MFVTFSNPTEFETYLIDSFSLYQKDIMKLTLQQWNDEALKGESKVQYSISYYYMSIYLVIVIYMDVKQGFITNWADVETKYNLACIRKALQCKGIILDKILNVFGLPFTNTSNGGIGSMDIDNGFEIGAEDVPIIPPPPIDVLALLANPNVFTNYLNTVCVPI